MRVYRHGLLLAALLGASVASTATGFSLRSSNKASVSEVEVNEATGAMAEATEEAEPQVGVFLKQEDMAAQKLVLIDDSKIVFGT